MNHLVPLEDHPDNCFPVLEKRSRIRLGVGMGNRTPGCMKMWSASSMRQRLCVPGDLLPRVLEYSTASYLEVDSMVSESASPMSGVWLQKLTLEPPDLVFHELLKRECGVGTCPIRC